MGVGKKLRVVHVVYSLTIGGVTNVLQQLVAEEREGIEQELILLSEKQAVPTTFSQIQVYSLNYKLPEEYTLKGFASIWLFPKKYFGAVVLAVEKIYKKNPFDIYHFHGIPKDLPIGSMLQKKYPAIKLVYTDHLLRIAEDEYGGIKTKLLAFLYSKIYKPYNVIFVSKAIYASAKAAGFVNARNKNQVIENSVDAAKIAVKKSYTMAGTINIVYVSRISAVKGHFLLMPVANTLINKYGISNFKITLIGPGELSGQLQEAINKEGLSSYFELAGPKQNVAALLPDFDMAVFPSEREGLPIALLEKMASGLAVVASDIPEIKNVIQKENEALLFPVNNAEACAEQLYTLIKNELLRKETGMAARKAVEERYAKPLIEKYLEFYKEIPENKQYKE
jgi:glycosyltransferase involved in cell wall biosynthesis